MQIIFKRPFLIGILVFIVLSITCLLVNIPMYDCIATYSQNLVHFQADVKLSLPHVLGWNRETLIINGLVPSAIELKPMGIAVLILIHIGFPFLAALRFHFANKRAEIKNEE